MGDTHVWDQIRIRRKLFRLTVFQERTSGAFKQEFTISKANPTQNSKPQLSGRMPLLVHLPYYKWQLVFSTLSDLSSVARYKR